MNIKYRFLAIAIALVFPASLVAADKTAAGPKGGRLLENTDPAAEVFVHADRRLEITFYDATLQPRARAAQQAAVTAELPEQRTSIELIPTATGFKSQEPLPAGEPYRLVVQLRERPEARPRNFRIMLNLEPCAECSYAEYACVCGH
ncbi:MAG TPA: hypothetical protein VHF69_10665 [Candidatus Synoicihabitans sp.]|nr:hypothetical protein [Candidatus Synoicihabitans sp.]